MKILLLVVVVSFIASSQGTSMPMNTCFMECEEAEHKCTAEAKEDQDARDTCSYNFFGVCLKKCDGLEVTETRDQYICLGKCYSDCGFNADPAKYDECLLNEYNCQRGCMDKKAVSGEQYQAAFAKCDPEMAKCYQENLSSDCYGEFDKCMDAAVKAE